MRKVHGWYIVFVGYVFQLMGIFMLLLYAQIYVDLMSANPYLVLTIFCGIVLGLTGTYVVHRATQ